MNTGQYVDCWYCGANGYDPSGDGDCQICGGIGEVFVEDPTQDADASADPDGEKQNV